MFYDRGRRGRIAYIAYAKGLGCDGTDAHTARQQGCKVYGLSDYQIIKKAPHRVMLGYASLSLSGIEEGMGLLEKAWL